MGISKYCLRIIVCKSTIAKYFYLVKLPRLERKMSAHTINVEILIMTGMQALGLHKEFVFFSPLLLPIAF